MKVFIILDRSGSMASRWAEVTKTLTLWLVELKPETKTWGLAFDNEMQWFATKFHAGKVSFEGIGPRNVTALYDAIAEMDKVVATEVKPEKKAQIVILTDGHENASHKTTKEKAGEIIAGWKAKGFDVVYFGADFDGFDEASKVGIAAGQTMSFDSHNVAETASVLSARSASYAATGKSEDFTDEDRKKVGG